MRKYFFVMLFCVSFQFSGFSQNDSLISETKAEQVLSLIKSSSVKSVKIMQLGDGFNKEYTNNWISEITIKNGLLTFILDEETFHSWNIEGAILIEKSQDAIIIRLGY